MPTGAERRNGRLRFGDFPYPENPWLDDEILLGGLAIVNQTLALSYRT
jgi:hypothetical protein